MASVVRRRRKDGSSSWYARYRDGAGKDRWERCPSAKDARARAAEAAVQLARSGGVWTPPAQVTVAEYAERWLAERGPALKPGTLADYRRIFERDLLPEFGTVKVAALTRSQIKQFMARRASAGASANTVRNVIAPLRAMLTSAVEDELIRQNVALRLPRVGKTQKRIEPPTREQVETVLTAASPAAHGPIAVAAISGLRRGEVFALRWADVDFDRKLLHVSRSNTNGTIGPTKTKSGERIVPIFSSLRKVLLEVRAASRYKSRDDLVFPTATGTPRSPNGWLRWEFYETLKASGVKRFRFHDLRHFAVSQLIAQGANILQIARVAGHSDPSVTLRVYGHLMADGLHQAAQLYDPLGGVAVDAV